MTERSEPGGHDGNGPAIDNPDIDNPDIDRLLAAAGQRLRTATTSADPELLDPAALRARAIFGGGSSGGSGLEAGPPEVVHLSNERRLRRTRIFAIAASITAVAALAGLLATRFGPDTRGADTREAATSDGQVAESGQSVRSEDGTTWVGNASPGALALVSKLPNTPVDPAKVRLVSTINSFDDCAALLDNLRKIGAAHVGSAGFNGPGNALQGAALEAVSFQSGKVTGAPEPVSSGPISSTSADGGDTVGTNIQVAGVDEPDVVKAVGSLAFDIRNNRLRIVDTKAAKVLGTVEFDGGTGRRSARVDTLLVSGPTAIVFGQESVQSEPIEGDTSASTAVHQYLTVTFVDVTDPAKPTVADRVRIDGHLVSARLVNGSVRMVTGSYLANIGFVTPTSPESIPTALDVNRLSVAESRIQDWIPQYERAEGGAQPLLPCDRVSVPETFAGVAMTSMVQFPVASRFEPSATGLLAPSNNLYATAERVTIAAEVWVDPSAAIESNFEDWRTAIHQFAFGAEAPGYAGSAIVDGSVKNQFSFGEVGQRLAVVATAGVPWNLLPDSKVNMTLFDQAAGPVQTARLDDLGAGGSVSGVRFTSTRAVVSMSRFAEGQLTSQVRVIDLSNPGAPVAGASLATTFAPEYLHPINDTELIALGRYSEPGPAGRNGKTGVRAALLNVNDPSAPQVSEPWSIESGSTEATEDHHAFLWWPAAKLAAIPLMLWSESPGEDRPPVAAFLGANNGLNQLGLAQPTEVDVPAPCPEVDRAQLEASGALAMLGEQRALRCEDAPASGSLDWPGHSCWPPDEGTLKQFGSEAEAGRIFVCGDAGFPSVRRIMVIDGATWLNTSESMERINAQSMASEALVPIG